MAPRRHRAPRRLPAALGALLLAAVALGAAGPGRASAARLVPPPVAPRPHRAVVAADAGVLGIRGDTLTLDGTPHFFTGVDAYSAGTDWGVNAGCGTMYTQAEMNQLFSSLPAGSLVRVWAFQGSIGTDAVTHRLDWGPLDRVLRTAAAYHQLVVLVLGNQSGTCDGDLWHDAAWYGGGYRAADNAEGTTPLSYWRYLVDAVEHFRSSPALAMWEPISEPEASECDPGFDGSGCYGHLACPNETAAAAALRSFFDTVGAEIHALDPAHPVESGLLGSGQCGTEGPDWAYVSDSPGIDVTSYHDYYAPTTPVGGDEWNGERLRLRQAEEIGKPVVAGEVGVMAATTPGAPCPSPAARAADITGKIEAQRALGLAGALVWDYVPVATAPGSCSYDLGPADPTVAALGTIATSPTATSPTATSPTATSPTATSP